MSGNTITQILAGDTNNSYATKLAPLFDGDINQAKAFLKTVQENKGLANVTLDVKDAPKFFEELRTLQKTSPDAYKELMSGTYKDITEYQKKYQELATKGKSATPAPAGTPPAEETPEKKAEREEKERLAKEGGTNPTRGVSALGAMDPETRALVTKLLKAFVAAITGKGNFEDIMNVFDEANDLADRKAGNSTSSPRTSANAMNGAAKTETHLAGEIQNSVNEVVKFINDDKNGLKEKTGPELVSEIEKRLTKSIEDSIKTGKVTLPYGIKIEDIVKPMSAAIGNNINDPAKLTTAIATEMSAISSKILEVKKLDPMQPRATKVNENTLVYSKNGIALTPAMKTNLVKNIGEGISVTNKDGVDLSDKSELTLENIQKKLDDLGPNAKVYVAKGKDGETIIRIEKDKDNGFNITVPRGAAGAVLDSMMKEVDKANSAPATPAPAVVAGNNYGNENNGFSNRIPPTRQESLGM